MRATPSRASARARRALAPGACPRGDGDRLAGEPEAALVVRAAAPERPERAEHPGLAERIGGLTGERERGVVVGPRAVEVAEHRVHLRPSLVELRAQRGVRGHRAGPRPAPARSG